MQEQAQDGEMSYHMMAAITGSLGIGDDIMTQRMKNVDKQECVLLLERMREEPLGVLAEHRKMQKIIAIMYQFAGQGEEISEAILDVLSDPAKASDEAIDAMLTQGA